jgi:hypothetical protein
MGPALEARASGRVGAVRSRRWRAIARAVLLPLALSGGASGACRASAMRFCDQPVTLTVEQKDTLLRFGGIVKTALETSGQGLALIARSGLNLSGFGMRYSHAGLSLKGSANGPWSVRQLYYACDEFRPRIYDQGMTGFLLGLNDPSLGFVSIVLIPTAQAAQLEHAALDDRQALRALSETYSANAYPFSVRYQNCNQWVIEMLAAAWGQLDRGGNLRTEAQQWLKDEGYAPSVFELGWRPAWLGLFIPWVHEDDHPAEDLQQRLYRVSMPASIEAFVRERHPGATRLELCHADRRVVIHRGWEPIAEGCHPAAQDTVITLD